MSLNIAIANFYKDLKNPKKIFETEFLIDIRQIFMFMSKGGVKFRFFSQSLILSLLLSLFSMYTVSLLLPLVQGIISNDFTKVKHLLFIQLIVRHFSLFFKSSRHLFLLLVLWVYITIFIKNVLYYFAFMSSDNQAQKAKVRIRELLLERCLSFGKDFYSKNKMARVQNILSRSTESITEQFRSLQNLIIQLLLLAIYIFLMLRISWALCLLASLILPLISLSNRKIGQRVKTEAASLQDSTADLNKHLSNIFLCLPLVKGFVKEQVERDIFSIANQKEIENSFQARSYLNLLTPIEDITTTTGILLIAIGMLGLKHIGSNIEPAQSFIFVYLVMKAIATLNTINRLRMNLARYNPALNEIAKIFSNENDQYVIHSGNIILTKFQQSISIRNLSFSYTPEKNILKNISFEIEKGKTTAIVGPTGSGKSTLFNLLLRFYDCPEKSIFIDGIDIKEYEIQSLRRRISFVEQDNLLFHDTIFKNITYGAEENLSLESIRDTCRQIDIDDFVAKLPEGYNTIIGEHGRNFSGGEKQRLAIARAFIKNADIFLMDEATSALDPKTELQISAALSKFKVGKTFVIISHRLSSVKNADKIIYLDRGAIIESGTLEQLLKLQGSFYQQWQAQKLT